MPTNRIRALLLLAMVAGLGLLSFWPVRGGWTLSRAGERWEEAWLELRFPFYSVSDRDERSVLKVQLGPAEPGRERHVAIVRGGAMRLWVDGRNVVNLLNVPPQTLAWSARQRLWVGGAPGEKGITVRVRRIVFYDRVLKSAEVRALYRAGWRHQPPAELGEPALVLRPAEGSPGARVTGSGRAGPVTLLLPPDAVRDTAGLWLTGTPAVSSEPVAGLAKRVRDAQAVTVDVWLDFPEQPAAGDRLVLAIAEGKQTNLRVELRRSHAEILVRGAYPSPKRVWDCALNFAGYAPLGLVFAWGRRSLAAACGGAFFLGGAVSLAVEILQLASPDRTPSFIDLAANSLGALAGAVLACLLTARR
mgnify:CR=1 FL=1